MTFTALAGDTALNIGRGGRCAVCKREIVGDDWDGRHSLHQPGCDRDLCWCDLDVHADCCPDCASGPSGAGGRTADEADDADMRSAAARRG